MVGHVVALRQLQQPQLQAGGHSTLQPYTEVTIQRTHTLRGESAPQVIFRIRGAYRPEEGVMTHNPDRRVPHIGHTFGIAHFRKGAAGSSLAAGAARAARVVWWSLLRSCRAGLKGEASCKSGKDRAHLARVPCRLRASSDRRERSTDVRNPPDAHRSRDLRHPRRLRRGLHLPDARQRLHLPGRHPADALPLRQRLGLAIEVLGFSPRGGEPDLYVQSYGSALRNRDTRRDYVSEEAYQNYLERRPYDQPRSFFPLDSAWQDEEEPEFVRESATTALIRGNPVDLPTATDCEALGIELEEPPALLTFEALRALAAKHRDALLATEAELRHSFADELEQVLQLDEWRHPDLVNDELPSESRTFQMLARVLVTGDTSHHVPEAPNTHWSNWPDGGTL